ncbi:MAG: response regulator [Bryobacterales bacterium]|nr:response regulator [Bryobacterales bacterium]
MHNPEKKILAVVADLFFSVKIAETAKKAGIALEFVTNGEAVMGKAKDGPCLIIFDLNFDAVEPLRLLRELKADTETRDISLLGYLSHVQADLKREAEATGCDAVMARSAFSMNLPQILKRHAGIP